MFSSAVLLPMNQIKPTRIQRHIQPKLPISYLVSCYKAALAGNFHFAFHLMSIEASFSQPRSQKVQRSALPAQLTDFVRPCRPIDLSLDFLTSCCRLLKMSVMSVNDHRLQFRKVKLMVFAKEHFLALYEM